MSGHCFDCGKTNKDEALNEIRQLAKQKAVQDGKAQAIFKEGQEYFIIEAGAAIAGSYPTIEFVSPYV